MQRKSLMLVSCLVVLFCVNCLNGQVPGVTIDLSDFELVGNVEYIKGTCYQMRPGGTKGENLGGFGYAPYKRFNQDGLLVEEQRYDDAGDTIVTVFYDYNENRLTHKRMVTAMWWSERWEMLYDDTNHVRSTKMYRNEKLSLTSKAEFSSDGLLLRSYNIDARDSIRSEFRHEYDASGRMIKVTGFLRDGSLIDERNYEYDSIGNKTRYARYVGNEDRKLAETVTYEYDEHNNKTLVTTTTYGGLSGTNVASYKYDYDTVGNWVRMYCYANGKPNQIVEREIKYY